MRRILGVIGASTMIGAGILAGGCSANDRPQSSEANSAQSAPYTPGTGVASSSFDRHPRFYTGPNGEQQQAPPTQP